MSMYDHTPGDWEFQPHDIDSQWAGNITSILGHDENGCRNIRTIACIPKYAPDSERAGNHLLLAAAPRLLRQRDEAVKQLRETIRLLSDHFDSEFSGTCSLAARMAKLDPARAILKEIDASDTAPRPLPC